MTYIQMYRNRKPNYNMSALLIIAAILILSCFYRLLHGKESRTAGKQGNDFPA
ncbi:MAG: hypothetical protein IPJ02_17465 [Chitinophagaceae bacterium]|nr:hypothetical protein [Chitinophagaceae bacterium]